jgi:hypothetical protein
MRPNHAILLSLLNFYLITSCKPVYYIPNTQNVPALQAKGEHNIALATADGHGELQFASAITKNVTVQANGQLIFPNRNRDEDSNSDPLVSGGFVETGLGYYRLLGDNILFEIYGLAGWGRIKNDSEQSRLGFPGTRGILTADLIRTAIQPSLTFLNTNWSASASVRMARLQFSRIEGDLFFEGEPQRLYLNQHLTSFLLEPALTIKAGFDPFYFQLQIQRSLNLTHSDFRQDNSHTSLGITYRFH